MNEKTPIYTKITNLTDSAFTFYYTGKGAVWIGAHATVTVPYELWSAADWKQREGLAAAVLSKQVSLTLGVIQTDGSFKEFDYQPNLALGLKIPAEEVPVVRKADIKPAKYDEKDVTKPVGAGDKIILASDKSSQKLAKDYGVDTNEPGVPVQKEIINGEAVDVSSQPPAEKTQNLSDKWAEYSKAIEEKRWAEAADMLNAMGANPKATARGLMALKDRSVPAVSLKFNLAQD